MKKQEPFFLLWVGLFFPSLALFTYSVLKGGLVDPQWLNLNFFAMLFAVAVFLRKYAKDGFRKKFLSLSLITGFVITFLVILHVNFRIFGKFVPPENDSSLELVAWDKTAKKVKSVFDEFTANPEILITRNYADGGGLSIYLPDHPFPYSLEKAARNLWVNPQELRTRRIAFACDKDSESKCETYLSEIFRLSGKQLHFLDKVQTFHPYTDEFIRGYRIYGEKFP